MKGLRYLTLAAVGLLSSLAVPTTARATTITYSIVGSFSGATFGTGGLTATAQNGGTLSIVSGSGLGVLGGGGGLGAGLDAIDNTESVLFSFDSGGATGVAFGSDAAFSNGGGLLMNLEAFDVHGASLGLLTFNILDATSIGTPIDVSALFGNVVLSAFRIAGPGTDVGIELHSVAFTDVAATAVPEPGTLLLCASGLALVGRARRRATQATRRRSACADTR
jgi:hypothetical protein